MYFPKKSHKDTLQLFNTQCNKPIWPDAVICTAKGEPTEQRTLEPVLRHMKGMI